MNKKKSFQQLFQNKRSDKPLFFPVIDRYAAVLQNRVPNEVFLDPTMLSNGLIQAQRLLDFDGYVLQFPLEEIIRPLSDVTSIDWDTKAIKQSEIFRNIMDVVQRIKVINPFIPVFIILPGPLTVTEALNSLSSQSGEAWINDLEIAGEIISELAGEFVKRQIDAVIIKDSQARPVSDQDYALNLNIIDDLEEVLASFLELTENITSFYQCKLIYSYPLWEDWLKQVHVQGLVFPIQSIQDGPLGEFNYIVGCEIDLRMWMKEDGDFKDLNLPNPSVSNSFILTSHPVPDNCNPVSFRKWIEYIRS